MGRPKGVWHWRLAPCLEAPGEERLVMAYAERQQAKAAAYNLRRGVVDLPAGTWTARHDLLGDGTWGLFVLYEEDDGQQVEG